MGNERTCDSCGCAVGNTPETAPTRCVCGHTACTKCNATHRPECKEWFIFRLNELLNYDDWKEDPEVIESVPRLLNMLNEAWEDIESLREVIQNGINALNDP